MKRRAAAVAVVLGAAGWAGACLWDYDTLRDERRGLPGVAEVLAGRFERHSRFFYERRVAAMRELLAREPGNLGAYDNLAVAYEKLGEIDRAIEVMGEKEKVSPGQYTTHANLGTFYFHKGDLAAGIPHIEAALRVNPEAHFGREEYQLRLAKYLLETNGRPVERLKDFLGISLFVDAGDGGVEPNRQLTFKGSSEVIAKHDPKGKAMEGTVGMIRFGTGTSPDLYYALGNLLTLRGDKHLAVRAYQRAIDFAHPQAGPIGELVAELRQYVEEDDRDASAEAIAAERRGAEEWVRAYQAYEDDLLRAGRDLTDERYYEAFYARHGRGNVPVGLSVMDWLPRQRGNLVATMGVVLLTAGLGAVWVGRVVRKRRGGMGI